MAGRPAFEPTQEQRLTVSIMAASGFSQDVICERIINNQTGKPIDKKTLQRAFRVELDEGMATTNALVAQALFKKATGNGPQSVTAAIFWLKTRAGWKETNVTELTGKDGAPLPQAHQLTDEQMARVVKKLASDV